MTVQPVETWYSNGSVLLHGADTPRPLGPAPLPAVMAEHSDKVVESWGVQAHYDYTDAWGPTHRDFITDLYTELGVRYVRDRWTPGSSGIETYWPILASRGIRVHATFIVFNASGQTTLANMRTRRDDMKTAFGSPLSSVVASVAGPNEPNDEVGGRPSNWASLLSTQVQNLWAAWREDSDLDDIPVVSPAFKNVVTNLQQDYITMGDHSAYCDYGDMHLYPAGQLPSHDIALRKGWARVAWGAAPKPFFCTEGGYNDINNYTLSGHPVDRATDATYMPRHLFEHINDGTLRWFKYQLLDSHGSALDVGSNQTDKEAHWGLIAVPSFDHTTWVRKPSFYTMKNLLARMADPGSAYTAQPLNMNITGGGSAFKWRLYQKRNGRHQIVLWRDVKVWDTATNSPITVPPVNAVVNISGLARSATLWDPTSSNSVPQRSYTAATQFTVPLAGKLLILELN